MCHLNGILLTNFGTISWWISRLWSNLWVFDQCAEEFIAPQIFGNAHAWCWCRLQDRCNKCLKMYCSHLKLIYSLHQKGLQWTRNVTDVSYEIIWMIIMMVKVFKGHWFWVFKCFELQPSRLSISRVTFHGDWLRKRLAVLGSPRRCLGDPSWPLNGRNIMGWTTGISLGTIGILDVTDYKAKKHDPSSIRVESLQVHCAF
jgi:hypothetical protein